MVISPNHNASSLSRKFVEAARGAALGSADGYNGHAYQGAWLAELAVKVGFEPPKEHAFGVNPVVIAPRSRGRLTLRSANPLDPPRIDFGLLSDPVGFDASVLWKGVRLARRIAATSALAEENSGEVRPGASAESDFDLLEHATREGQTMYHPTGTCPMGSDGNSVVDPHLRMRGVDGLWVADASALPAVPRGHPNAVVAMIAERAAGWIG